MPHRHVTVFQAKGRNHIRYINRMMHNIWEKYGYKDEMKIHALGEAFQKHITYLRSLEAEPQPVVADTEPPKRITGTWWRNKDDKWEPL